MAGVALYWHTIRHLKPIQLYGRVWFRLSRPRVDPRPAPTRRPAAADAWVPGAERPASMRGPRRFEFLNEPHELAERGWDDPRLGKLWRYHLHYFDDLNASEAASRAAWHHALLTRWVRENPPPRGTGWEPYPTSLRVVNWIKWALRGNALPPECVHSLAVQVRWLSRRVETYLLGNHLFVNAKALVFAGLYFDGPEATGWLERGLRILTGQLPEQILPDGGQFERSTMYHALALEDMLDLCNLAATYGLAIASRWRALTGPMRQWLMTMCHPDGQISQFNDAALDIAPAPQALEQYARRLGLAGLAAPQPVTQLGDSGYVRVERAPAVVLLDVAPVGPDHVFAHAHADTLSFELSLFGRRVLVNSGTSCYGCGAERLRQRGTAAHNTVVVDGADSSEVWSDFRLGRRARPVGLEVARNGVVVVRCAHDGYERLPGKPRHARRWSIGPHALIVHDTLTGAFRCAQARFHLHPSVVVHDGGDREGIVHLELPNGDMVRFSVTGGRLRQERTTWHPRFGVSQPNVCLAVDFSGPELGTEVRWSGTE